MNESKYDNFVGFIVLQYIYTCMQLLQELSPVPCTTDINFAKKASIMKRNRYKDRFPCEPRFLTFYSVVCMKRLDHRRLKLTTVLYVMYILSYNMSCADSTDYLHLAGKAAQKASKTAVIYYNASFVDVSYSNFYCQYMACG